MTSRVGLLLTRAPIVLPSLKPFAESYLRYKAANVQAMAKPFDPTFYYKKGTFAEERYQESQTGDTVVQPIEEELLQLPEPREADESITSLERRMDSDVYMAIKQKNGLEFPVAPVSGTEFLHDAAQSLIKSYGERTDTWIVSPVPAGHLESADGNVYFIKSRIMAGVPQGENIGWYTKQELEEFMSPNYFAQIKGMLA